MSDIKRTGPPTPRGVKGDVFTWTVSISAAPHPQWKYFFLHTKDQSVTCQPESVRFYLNTAIFECSEDNVPMWIEFIDRWLQAANERFAKWEADERREQARGDEQKRDPAQRLRDAAEKFKHL